MKPLNEKYFLAAISAALDKQIKEICEEEAKKAAVETERRVRAKVCEIVGNVSSWFSHERLGQDLRITVRFPKTDEPSSS